MVCCYAKDSKGTYGVASEQGLSILHWVKSQSFLALQPYHITHYLQLSSIVDARPSGVFQHRPNCTALMPFHFRFPEVKACSVSSHHAVSCMPVYFVILPLVTP